MSRLACKGGLIPVKNPFVELENKNIKQKYPQRSSERLHLKDDEVNINNNELHESPSFRLNISSSKRHELLNNYNNSLLEVVNKEYDSNKPLKNNEKNNSDKIELENKKAQFSLNNYDLSTINIDLEKAIYLTKICLENAELNDAIKYAEDIIFYCTAELKADDRNLVICSFKSYLLNKRNSYKNILIIHNKEKETNSKYSKLIAETKISLEGQILKACERQIVLINKHIMHKIFTIDGKADFLKLKADVYRYLCEISSGELLNVNKDNCTQLYKECLKVCDGLSPLNHIRVGAYLNFSVYCYEILQNPYFSLSYSTKGLKSAIDELSFLEIKNKYNYSYIKDTLEILHVLKENITEWYKEIEAKEGHSALSLTNHKIHGKILKNLPIKKD